VDREVSDEKKRPSGDGEACQWLRDVTLPLRVEVGRRGIRGSSTGGKKETSLCHGKPYGVGGRQGFIPNEKAVFASERRGTGDSEVRTQEKGKGLTKCLRVKDNRL